MIVQFVSLERSEIVGDAAALKKKNRSSLLRTIETVSLAPFLMSGRMVEQQTVFIEFFQDFSDNPLNPVVSAMFEIKSRFAEIYDAELIIHAKFSGLRYFMFYFPLTSAVIGSSLNMAILSLVVALSWFRQDHF